MDSLVAFRIAVVVLAILGNSTASKAADNSSDLKYEIVVNESPLLTDGQVVKLNAPTLKKRIVEALYASGFLIARQGYDRQLKIEVLAYDSGKYFGGAKTATMTVHYILLDDLGAAIDKWDNACRFRARLDFQSSPARNISAVDGCLTDLFAQLSARLSGATTKAQDMPGTR